MTDGPRVVEPHVDGQADAELLAAKLKGARDKGWAVRRTSPGSFTATKKRWASGTACIRDFWTD